MWNPFNRRKRRAIAALEEQIALEYGLKPLPPDTAWCAHTMDLIREYVGPESQQHQMAKTLYEIALNENYLESHAAHEAHRVVRVAIEYIQRHGVYRPVRINFLCRLPAGAVATVLVGLVGGMFTLGFIIGRLERRASSPATPILQLPKDTTQRDQTEPQGQPDRPGDEK